MDDLGRGKAVEERAAGRGVRADVRRVDEVAELQVRQLLRQADRVERVTGRAEDGAELRRPFLETLQRVLAVVEDHAAERLVDAVVDVVTEFALADGLADDLGDGRRRRRDQEAAGFGEDFDLRREQAIESQG